MYTANRWELKIVQPLSEKTEYVVKGYSINQIVERLRHDWENKKDIISVAQLYSIRKGTTKRPPWLILNKL